MTVGSACALFATNISYRSDDFRACLRRWHTQTTRLGASRWCSRKTTRTFASDTCRLLARTFGLVATAHLVRKLPTWVPATCPTQHDWTFLFCPQRPARNLIALTSGYSPITSRPSSWRSATPSTNRLGNAPTYYDEILSCRRSTALSAVRHGIPPTHTPAHRR